MKDDFSFYDHLCNLAVVSPYRTNINYKLKVFSYKLNMRSISKSGMIISYTYQIFFHRSSVSPIATNYLKTCNK